MVLIGRSALKLFILFLFSATGLGKDDEKGKELFQRWIKSKLVKSAVLKKTPKVKQSDVYWSGKPISYDLHSAPNDYKLPNRVKVPIYPGSSAWTWGDKFQVDFPSNDAFIKFRPIGLPHKRPPGQYHQHGIFIKNPETVVPSPPLSIRPNDYNHIVESLSSPSLPTYSPPKKAYVSARPYEGMKPASRPANSKPSNFFYVQDNLHHQLHVESSGSNKTANASSSLLVVDPDDSNELTLLHGTVLVSSSQKRPVPQPVYRPSEHFTLPTPVFQNPTKGTSIGFNDFADLHPHLVQSDKVTSPDTVDDTGTRVTNEPSENSSHSSLPNFQDEDLDVIAGLLTSSDIQDGIQQATKPMPTESPISVTISTGPMSVTSQPDSSTEYETLIIPTKESSATEEPYHPDVQAVFASGPSSSIISPHIEESFHPDIQPVFAPDPSVSPSLISSQILPSGAQSSLNILAPATAAQPLNFQPSPIPTLSTSNVLTASSGLSSGTLLQFILQLAFPVVLFFGIVFLLVGVSSGRRRRRDLSSEMESLLKIPDGFPLEILGSSSKTGNSALINNNHKVKL